MCDQYDQYVESSLINWMCDQYDQYVEASLINWMDDSRDMTKPGTFLGMGIMFTKARTQGRMGSI